MNYELYTYVHIYNVCLELFEEISAHYYTMHVSCCICTPTITNACVLLHNVHLLYIILHNVLYVCPIKEHSPIFHTTMYTKQTMRFSVFHVAKILQSLVQCVFPNEEKLRVTVLG